MINVLKKGLKTLKKRVASRKIQLEADLKVGNIVSTEDEEWLDGAGNLIDEERVVEVLGDDAPLGPTPSRHEALQAKLTIEKCIQMIDESYAHKLENILALFSLNLAQ